MDLINSKAKKQAKENLERVVNTHKDKSKVLQDSFVELQGERDQMVKRLKKIEDFINSIKNTPEHFNKNVQTLTINLSRYEALLAEAKKASANIEKGAGAGLAAGLVAGGAVGVFGGSALTAVAMSIGTASTGAAISGLTGVAATNAALAWLGGGAIAAGGAGIAGGEALLALTGPIGWAIGGAAAVGTGLWARGKNATAAEEMQQQTVAINAEIASIMALVAEVRERTRLMTRTYLNLSERLLSIEHVSTDYNEWNDAEIKQVGTLVNNALSAEKILNAKLGDDGKFHEDVVEIEMATDKLETAEDDDIASKLTKLYKLYNQNLITEDEYNDLRQKYLSNL